ncbi:MAG TPA: ABC transporter permease [Caldilineaceae bacterium]|nr:ABC transporter permease [Caldilineaceae bacterium]
MMAVRQAELRPAGQAQWLERLNQELLLSAFLLLLVIVLTALRPDFLSGQSVSSILMDSSHLIVAAVGMTLVIVAGGIDISVGSMLAMCAVIGGLLAQSGVAPELAMLAIVLSGTLFGLINGSLVVWGGIPSIIVSLGMLSILRGAVVLLTGGSWIQNLPQGFYIGQRSVLGLPVPILVAVVVLAAAALWMRYSPLGRQVYAVGANREAARLTGINVKRIQLLTFTVNGTLVGLAALIFATRFSAIQTNAGVGFELQVITAAVVGGVSIMGGAGTVLGAALGGLLLNVISKGMIFLRVSAYWFLAVQGALILLAVVVDIWRKRRLGEL